MAHNHCCKTRSNSAFTQTLEELDFERGIWSAAADGDLSKVELMLNKGIAVDKRDASGHTALHHAALHGHEQICKLLLSSGANINAVTKAGNATSLHRSSSSGKKNIVDMLIHHGADLTIQDVDGRTALHRAFINGHFDIAQILSHHSPQLLTIPDNKNKYPNDYCT